MNGCENESERDVGECNIVLDNGAAASHYGKKLIDCSIIT